MWRVFICEKTAQKRLKHGISRLNQQKVQKMPRKLQKMEHSVAGVFEGLEVGTQALEEARSIARQVQEADGKISPADASQLRELAVLLQRQEDAAKLGKAALDSGDAKTWLDFTRMGEHLTTSKRGLLRDLKVTRFFKPGGEVKASTIKADQKSGKAWLGVI